MTLREVLNRYHGKCITDWNHTSLLAALQYNTYCLLYNQKARSGRLRPKSFSDFHPYMKKVKTGIRINKSNFRLLKDIARGLV